MTSTLTTANAVDITGVTVSFGGFNALRDLNATFPQGEVSGLIGPNGAGKTTLLNLLSGLVKATTGEATVMGQSVAGLKAPLLWELGVSRTYQHPRLFKRGTVLDNIIVGVPRDLESGRGVWLPWSSSANLRAARKTAREWMERMGWTHLLGRPVAELTLPEQREVELLRAVAARPRLLLLDEPSSGLGIEEVKQMLLATRPLLPEGASVILVSHDVPLVFDMTTWVVVLATGTRVEEGPTKDVAESPEVRRVYLGSTTA